MTDAACFDGQAGTASGTDAIEGRFNNAPPNFHFTAVATGTYRIDFAGGRYVLGAYRTKINEEANNESGTVRQIDTEVTQDQAVVYLAGEQVGTVTVHQTLHTIWEDANGNHQVDAGEMRTLVDNIRVSCP